jgi:hypothetical protein
VRSTSTARRQYVGGSFHCIAWHNNVFPRAKLARYVRYAVLGKRPANGVQSGAAVQHTGGGADSKRAMPPETRAADSPPERVREGEQ